MSEATSKRQPELTPEIIRCLSFDSFAEASTPNERRNLEYGLLYRFRMVSGGSYSLRNFSTFDGELTCDLLADDFEAELQEFCRQYNARLHSKKKSPLRARSASDKQGAMR
ncbi:MAG: hypothetical protein AAF394_06355 [Planctomycetota bacterium]